VRSDLATACPTRRRAARAAGARILCTLALAAGLLLAPVASGDDAGDLLARRVHERVKGSDLTFTATMQLTERGRSARLRQLVVYRAHAESGAVSTLVRFTAPAELAGTGLLTLDPPDGAGNQWIWLPAFERVRRIESGRQGGRFVDSDFYFEDLRDRKVGADRHRIVARERVDGVPFDVLESLPVDPRTSTYLKRLSWIDVQTLVPRRVDLYEKRSDRPSKRLTVTRQEEIDHRWTAVDSTMTDLDSGHETRLLVDKVAWDRKLPADLFTPRTLEVEAIERGLRP
jgi:hypothetical protein